MASKVITLPVDDPSAALALFQEWLGKNKILFIVLRDTAIAKNTVRKADSMAGDIDHPLWVLHAPNEDDVMDILKTIPDPKKLIINWEKPLAIALSMDGNICDMIPRGEAEPTYARIARALVNAGINE
ncbi:MAG: hypothetical protein HUU01_04215 [Saprospiraceae bacterium]|nr:hypothetical protein [Saprospiraceae bacterium]